MGEKDGKDGWSVISRNMFLQNLEQILSGVLQLDLACPKCKNIDSNHNHNHWYSSFTTWVEFFITLISSQISISLTVS